MPRANGSAPPEAIRIEDEVWEEAFARREPASDNRRRRLHAIDGGQSDWLSDGQSEWLSELHADWREDPSPTRPVSGVSRSTSTRPTSTRLAAPGKTEPSAATWLGGSSVPRAEAATSDRFDVAAGDRARVVTGDRAGVATGDRADIGTARPTEATPAGRRTIKIQGRGAERHLPMPDATRRRPPRRPYERAGFRPDRLAMWAVILGFLLVIVATASGHS